MAVVFHIGFYYIPKNSRSLVIHFIVRSENYCSHHFPLPFNRFFAMFITAKTFSTANGLRRLYAFTVFIPFDVSQAREMTNKPEPMPYPMTRIPVRHYGKMMFEVFEHLKTMPAGKERDELVRVTANQMKRMLLQWSHGTTDDEKVANDLERYTDGQIKLDLKTFKFDKISERDFAENRRKKK